MVSRFGFPAWLNPSFAPIAVCKAHTKIFTKSNVQFADLINNAKWFYPDTKAMPANVKSDYDKCVKQGANTGGGYLDL